MFPGPVPLRRLLAGNRHGSAPMDERFGRKTHISPSNFCIDLRWHISAAVLLLQLSFAGDQPLLQHGTLLLELLRKRQSFFQVLLALGHLREKKSVAIIYIYPI